GSTLRYQYGGAMAKQLDEGIVDTFVLVDVFGELPIMRSRRSNRFAGRAEAAIVTSRQCRLVVPGWLSINSNSSSQSNAESWAWSGPSNSFTALMNAENSRSAISVCSLQMEVENDSLVFIGSSSVSAMPSTRSGAFIPHVHKVSD